MHTPFEAPEPGSPKKDPAVDIDFDDILDASSEGAATEAVADAFFQKNLFLKSRFEKEPGAMDRFKAGLRDLIDDRARVYAIEPEGLASDPRFQQDLVKYSFAFEDEEVKRNAGKRAA